ncbi:MAG: hypothetical protein EAZ50_08405 [Runella slithyformis]|nr:MAG: hypothetical protein EAZ50_08405 [Runella slithyformis]
MKKLETEQMELVNGGGGWDYYAASCGVASLTISYSMAVPALFGANAIYLATCGLLLPLAKASGY